MVSEMELIKIAEQEILNAVRTVLAKLERDTGLSAHAVDIRMVDVETESVRRCIVTAVEVHHPWRDL